MEWNNLDIGKRSSKMHYKFQPKTRKLGIWVAFKHLTRRSLLWLCNYVRSRRVFCNSATSTTVRLRTLSAAELALILSGSRAEGSPLEVCRIKRDPFKKAPPSLQWNGAGEQDQRQEQNLPALRPLAVPVHIFQWVSGRRSDSDRREELLTVCAHEYLKMFGCIKTGFESVLQF